MLPQGTATPPRSATAHQPGTTMDTDDDLDVPRPGLVLSWLHLRIFWKL